MKADANCPLPKSQVRKKKNTEKTKQTEFRERREKKHTQETVCSFAHFSGVSFSPPWHCKTFICLFICTHTTVTETILTLSYSFTFAFGCVRPESSWLALFLWSYSCPRALITWNTLLKSKWDETKRGTNISLFCGYASSIVLFLVFQLALPWHITSPRQNYRVYMFCVWSLIGFSLIVAIFSSSLLTSIFAVCWRSVCYSIRKRKHVVFLLFGDGT